MNCHAGGGSRLAIGLEKLLESYWAGLCQPLKFFPESSFAFAAAHHEACGAEVHESGVVPKNETPAPELTQDINDIWECA